MSVRQWLVLDSKWLLGPLQTFPPGASVRLKSQDGRVHEEVGTQLNASRGHKRAMKTSRYITKDGASPGGDGNVRKLEIIDSFVTRTANSFLLRRHSTKVDRL
ncbi:unnamed protein product [Dibothriocephalus latus]|uniref:Uncharacterized protein n=1 Tax=Dibothriocephalus latus TaxID=60516 RepID=A0A3P7NB20_DIBLA|nr:unnamed protein product [Dibothriocephalus latus]